ncbi:hypothetical protein BGZ90_000753 [Linnemannia elongata]|nr:hypothetical protein BGZ90_000753 [Linnemannia elongata]
MLDSTPVFEVLSIPELLDAIQVYLTLHDLAQCAVVSKSFQTLFTPLLWEIITIKTHRQHVAFTTVPEVQDALVRNAPHIRVLYLRTCKSLEPFLRVDSAHFKLLHTIAFPWTLRNLDQDYQYHDTDEKSQFLCASSVYTPPPFDLQDDGYSREKRRPWISYSAIDRIVAQRDWLRAKGMFPAREQAVGTQLHYLQQLQDQRRQTMERLRVAQEAAVVANAATIATPPGTSTASSSSSSSTAFTSTSTITNTTTMTPQQSMASLIQGRHALQAEHLRHNIKY